MTSNKSTSKVIRKSFKPNAYRIIGVIFALTIVLLVTLLLLSPAPEPVNHVNAVLGLETNYWEEIIGQNPTYLRGYVELAKLEIEGGNHYKAAQHFAEAKLINPNSNELQIIEDLLEE